MNHVLTRIVYTFDEGQLIESKGTVGLNKKPNGTGEGLSDETTNDQCYKSIPSAHKENTLFNKGQEFNGTLVSASVDHTSSNSKREADDAPPPDEVVMTPSMTLPTSDGPYVYVLGLRPIACRETYDQLTKADYVTGMLPFKKQVLFVLDYIGE